MKYALIIGNNKYDDQKLAQLKTPAADSQALAKVLDDKTIGSFDEVTPLINQTESQVRRAISSFLNQKKPDDLVLVYFSGHGVLDDRGRLFLALKDTQLDLLKATSLPSTFISDEMDSCRSKRQVLILDCCHSGAFARGTKGPQDQKAVTEATFEGSGYGRVVMTASDSTQYALEGDQVISQTDLSLFTHFLLEGLKSGDADSDNDGHISLDEWYDYTYARVISQTPKQIPHRWSYNQQGDLIIAKNPNVKKKVAALPDELMQALESSFGGIRESAVHELGKYLRSRDPQMVQLTITALETMKQDDSRRISSLAEKLLQEFETARAPVQMNSARPAVEVMPVTEKPVHKVEKTSTLKASRADESTSSQEFVFDGSVWLKWIGLALLAIIASFIMFNAFRALNQDSGETSFKILPILFGLTAGLIALCQWYFFRNQLRGWWVAANLIIGVTLGWFHQYMYGHQDSWDVQHVSVLLAMWAIGNFGLGLVQLRKPDGDAAKVSSFLKSGSTQISFLLLLSVAMICRSIAHALILFDRVDSIAPFWLLYGLSSIAISLSLLKKDMPRNIGFIALATLLLLDGIDVGIAAINPDFPMAGFALNGMTALVAGFYLILQKQIRADFSFLILSALILLLGVAGITIYVSEANKVFLALSIPFAIVTVIAFWVRRPALRSR
jgi:uncharacterized caspase-like protein